jgi:hypothetical protein
MADDYRHADKKVKSFTGKRSEWDLWKKKFLALITHKKYHLSIDTPQRPEGAAGAAWDEANLQLYTQLVLYCDGDPGSVVDQFEHTKNGRHAWRALLRKYDTHGAHGKATLVREMRTLEMGDLEDPDTFFIRIERLRRRMASIGFTLLDDEDHLKIIAVTLLPEAYNPIVVELEGRAVEYTYQQLKDQVVSFYTRSIFTQKTNKPISATATSQDTTTVTTALFTTDTTCGYCSKRGHQEYECRKKKREQQQQTKGQTKDNKFNKGNNKKSGSDKKCYTCGKTGHISTECRSKQKKRTDPTTTSTMLVTTSTGSDSDTSSCDDDDDIALLASMSTPDTPVDTKSTTWVVDSGCTTHMTASMQGLTSFVPKDGSVHAAGGHVLKSTGSGTLPILLRNNKGKDIKVTLCDVLIVPELQKSLLSVTKLHELGVNVLLGATATQIEAKNQVFPIHHNKGKSLYEVSIIRRHNSYPTSGAGQLALWTKSATSTASEDLALTWHRRMGHRNMGDLLALSKAGIGIPALKDISTKCDTCQLGKHTRTSFGTVKEPGQFSLMQQADVDLLGPLRPASLGGSRYACIFTERSTMWRSIYFMKSKDETLKALQFYLTDIKPLTGSAPLQTLKSDNGGEFVNANFQQFCKKNGIKQLFTGAYSPEQNGTAERGNRTVIEMARCMLIDSGLPRNLWAEAAQAAVYTINRMPTTRLQGATPYQLLNGHLPSLQHMRIFGSLAWVHIDAQHRSKLDPKSWKGAMVGYDPYNIKCYRIYDPVTSKVKSSTHVTFDERRTLDRTSMKQISAPQQSQARPSIQDTDPEDMDDDDPLTSSYPDMSDPVVPDSPATTRAAPQSGSPDRFDTRSGLLPLDTDLLMGAPDNTVHHKDAEDAAIQTNDTQDTKARSTSRFWTYEPVLPDSEAPTRLPASLRTTELRNLTWAAKDPSTSSSSSSRTAWCEDPTCDISTRHKAHLVLHQVYATVEGGISDPVTYQQALRSAQSHEWKQAMRDEYNSLVANGTWTLVPRPEGANIIGGKWVFKTKLDVHGQPIRYKARYVAKGFKQVHGVDYFDTYSPVTRMTTIRTFLAIASLEDWELESMDVDTAFLNAAIDEEIYVSQPEGFQTTDKQGRPLVCKLKKAIYGLRQASHNWNKTIDKWLRRYGLLPTQADSCAYLKKEKPHTLVVLLWVDDLIIGGDSQTVIDKFKTDISKCFKMKALGKLQWILGMEIHRDRSTRSLEVTQATYIQQMLERFGMMDCKSISTPAEGALPRSQSQTPATDSSLYMSIVGSLLYAAMVTRPDITYAVQSLGRHLQSSGPEHLAAAKRVLRYLQGTKKMGIKFSGGSTIRNKLLTGYSDSDWGGDPDTRRSTTAYLFQFGGGPISWSSRLQPTVALSSAEAEYMAVCAATQESTYLRQLLSELGYPQADATTIYEDNQGCIALARNPVLHKRTKHIEIRYHFIRERIESGQVKLEYIPTQKQLADILTKALPKPQFEALRTTVMGYGHTRSGGATFQGN